MSLFFTSDRSGRSESPQRWPDLSIRGEAFYALSVKSDKLFLQVDRSGNDAEKKVYFSTILSSQTLPRSLCSNLMRSSPREILWRNAIRILLNPRGLSTALLEVKL